LYVEPFPVLLIFWEFHGGLEKLDVADDAGAVFKFADLDNEGVRFVGGRVGVGAVHFMILADRFNP
jgi:hypothetical protein